uniref:Uncharacterized protein n=1 Tax=Plectus sambesii TaxID=2011161 RepID=A0A914WHR0_9BILA
MAKVTLVGLVIFLTVCISIYLITLIHLTSEDRSSYDDYLDNLRGQFSHPRSHMRRISYERQAPLERKTRLRFMSKLVDGRSLSTTAAYEPIAAEPERLHISVSTVPSFTVPVSQVDESVTVVSALLDIGRGKWWYYRRPFEIYLDYLEQMLRLDVNMVLFVDKKAVDFALKCRTHLSSKTVLYETSLADVPLWNYRQQMIKVVELEQKNFRAEWDEAMRHHPEASSADYDLAVNSKSYFLYNASVQNPFHSSHFVWLDAGYGHGTREVFPKNFRWSPTFPPGKISLIKLTPTTDLLDNYPLEKLYRQDQSVVSGGFVAGDRTTVGTFHSLFEQQVFALLRDGKVDDDQTILVLIIRAYPQLFNVVHGDWFDAFRLFP